MPSGGPNSMGKRDISAISITDLPRFIITEDPSLVRDTHSKALLNTDANALARHRRNVTKARASASDVAELRANQKRLDNRLTDINGKLDRLLEFLKR